MVKSVWGRWTRAAMALAVVGLVPVGPGSIGRAFAQADPQGIAPAPAPSSRIALVIGDGAYAKGPLPTAANDAGLVAQTLTAAGFDVTGARDLGGDAVRRAFREFLDKANAAGPDAIAFVYLSGYAVQFDGDNYFMPVDAAIEHDTDIPLQGVRLSDFAHALTSARIQSRVMVVDGLYRDPAVPASDHVAPGLSLVDPDPGTLMAFNAAPGTVAPTPTGSYGPYGSALAEMMRQGGVPVAEVFDRVRLRVNQVTAGAAIPWDADKLGTSFAFLGKAPDAPASASVQQSITAMSRRPLRDFPQAEAYSMAVARDNFSGYQDFLGAFPSSPYAGRVRAMLAVRREALFWRQAVVRNSPAAYWTYLGRYPRGPHVYDCRRRLRMLSAAFEPPPAFEPIVYDVPPPPPDEITIVDETVHYDFYDEGPPPPPPPVYVLPPPVVEFIDLPPPPPPPAPFLLPIPVPVPIPYVQPLVQPGVLVPLIGAAVQYRQPQPFVAAPNGGLQPQPAGRQAAPVPPGPGPEGIRPAVGGNPAGGNLPEGASRVGASPVTGASVQDRLTNRPGAGQPGAGQPGAGQPGREPSPHALPQAPEGLRGAVPAGAVPAQNHPGGNAGVPGSHPAPEGAPVRGGAPILGAPLPVPGGNRQPANLPQAPHQETPRPEGVPPAAAHGQPRPDASHALPLAPATAVPRQDDRRPRQPQAPALSPPDLQRPGQQGEQQRLQIQQDQQRAQQQDQQRRVQHQQDEQRARQQQQQQRMQQQQQDQQRARQQQQQQQRMQQQEEQQRARQQQQQQQRMQQQEEQQRARQQQEQQRMQQEQRMRAGQEHGGPPGCGHPGAPPCR